MTLWAFYFLAKGYLHFSGLMHIHIVSNLVLLGLVLVPIRKGDSYYRQLSAFRLAVAVVFAGYLLWSDSWLPPMRQLSKVFADGGGSIGNAWQLVAGPIDLMQAAMLLAILACCEFSARRGFRPMTLAVFLLGAIAVQNLGAASQAVGQRVSDFYDAEDARIVRAVGPVEEPSFDIVFLQIGSLSWDDLATADELEHPMLSRFDVLFSRFNSVSSYGTPAALRLLRGLCGQPNHDRLYRPWPANCSIVELLRTRGYRIYTAFNHTDKDGQMTKALLEFPKMEKPAPLEMMRTRLVNYDRTPIYTDLDVLSHWWKARQRDGAKRAALYYNSATLQAGAHEPVAGWWKESRVSRYRRRLDQLASDLDQFYATLEASGRNVVVFLVPAHGGGLREAVFSREIPTPRFTHVPAGIKLIAPGRAAAVRPIVKSESLSYLAVGQVIASFLRLPPFGPGATQRKEEAVARLPTVDYLGENESARFLWLKDGSYVFDKEKKWTKVRSTVLRQEATALPRFGS